MQPSIGLDEGDDEIDEMTKMIPREVSSVTAQDTHGKALTPLVCLVLTGQDVRLADDA